MAHLTQHRHLSHSRGESSRRHTQREAIYTGQGAGGSSARPMSFGIERKHVLTRKNQVQCDFYYRRNLQHTGHSRASHTYTYTCVSRRAAAAATPTPQRPASARLLPSRAAPTQYA